MTHATRIHRIMDMVKTGNQCDGCLAGVPIVNGFHVRPDGVTDMMCTADRYSYVQDDKDTHDETL